MKVIMPKDGQNYYKVIEGTFEAQVLYDPDSTYWFFGFPHKVPLIFEIRMNNNYSINRDGDIYIREGSSACGWTHIEPGEIKMVFAIRDAYNTAKLKMTEWYNECSTDTSNRERCR